MDIAEVFQIAATVLVSLGGGGAIVLALSSWFGRVWAERILAGDRRRFETQMSQLQHEFELDRRKLQALLERGLHVSRLHYETEFQALREVWAAAANARANMPSLHRGSGTAPLDETEEARRGRLWEEVRTFRAARSRYIDALYNNGPFIPDSVYQLGNQLSGVLASENTWVTLAQPAPFSTDWYDKGGQLWDQMIVLCDQMFHEIRERVTAVQAGLTAARGARNGD